MKRFKRYLNFSVFLPVFIFHFFIIIPTFVFAATPTITSISPTSGIILPNTAKEFSCSYSDASGWSHLKETYLLISSASTIQNNVGYLYYNQNTNLFYLRDDANVSWLGGFAPGSGNIIENSQVKLDCALSTAIGSGNALVVKFNISFKSGFSGKSYNTYLYAKDDAEKYAGWTKKGTYAINRPPELGTISPSTGTGQIDMPQAFLTTYSDSDGWENIQYVYFLINSSTSGMNCFYGYYDQNSNKLYLRNDANNAWLGGYAPGSANIIENSYEKLDCSQAIVSGEAATLTVKWPVVFKNSFTGNKNLYLYVKDDVNVYVNWTKKGAWNIPNKTPAVGIITPADGMSVAGRIFSAVTTYSDPDGWENIQYVYFLINSSTSGTNCFYGYYNQTSNKLYLRDDANTAWLGGYAPGSANIIENSYAILDCSQTTVTEEGNTLTVGWQGILKPTFLGQKKSYLYVKDNAGVVKGWVQKGVWSAFENGFIVGPAGGEVVSSSGKVKLIIPPGALSTAANIEINQIDNTSLENAAPSNTSLLNAVECKPYGLVFNEPVLLIYTFDHAEIPGTEIELGLYDSARNEIIPTGQSSVVGADGYSAVFSLEHFSTYAALKILTPEGAPIGSGIKIPLPDMFTGAFGHSIPFALPPGRKGVQPSLAITYRSSNPNSWAGMGASLNPGYITRSTRLGPPTYIDTQDTFYFITDAGTTELVHLVDNLYQAKIESSFTKFFKEADDSWKAVGKDGSILRFGQVDTSKEGSSQGTFSWYLTKAIDANSNYVDYYYIKDEGKVYLSHIDYTGNESQGLSPSATVEFILETREDVASSYLSSSRIATAKRLKEVLVKLKGSLVWRYVLGYIYSPGTNRSLLISVKQFAADGKALPEQKLGYQEN